MKIKSFLYGITAFMMLVCMHLTVFAADSDFPAKPNPPRLVNDFGHFLTDAEAAQLEATLENYNQTSSTEITIVTIKSLGDYDVSDYAIKLGNIWGVGKKGKDNGVMILASMDEHKINISTGKGLEGALTDALCGRIIRNEMVPSFKQGNYYEGFSKGVNAVIAATKGEYKADDKDGKAIPLWAILLLVGGVYFVLWLISKIRGGGGTYMSGGGFGGWWIGGGGFGGGGRGDGGGFGGGGGGFGGFGGGGFGGGGASGSW